ncbi:hypothetical protein [Cohnella laeviribosi]|uniref:hypothetical protein n=1 Tax=Cohnella laeviribosi TaxID=380174 RepID=UPI003D1AF73F
MKLSKKTLIPAALLTMALAVPFGASAATPESAQPGTQPSAAEAQAIGPGSKGSGFFVRHGGELFMKAGVPLGGGVHQQTYITLLAEKYAPDTVQAWKDAFAERSRLSEEFQSLRESEVWKNIPGEWKQDLSGQAKDKLETLKELKEKVKSGEWSKDQLKEEIENQLPEEAKERKERLEKFTEAVKSGDAERIKSALAELLTDFKDQNHELAQKLDELKQKLQQSQAETQS